MYYFLTIVFSVFLPFVSALDCGEHGRVVQCPCTKTCLEPSGPHFCHCIEGCHCHDIYLFDEIQQTCVLPEQCSQATLNGVNVTCPNNSHIEECPCKRTCVNPEGPDVCICEADCNCNAGYLFNEQLEECVLPDKCPLAEEVVEVTVETKYNSSCGEHGRMELCPCTKTCTKPEMPDFCTCNPGCVCEEGYLLSEIFSECVLADECFVFQKDSAKINSSDIEYVYTKKATNFAYWWSVNQGPLHIMYILLLFACLALLIIYLIMNCRGESSKSGKYVIHTNA